MYKLVYTLTFDRQPLVDSRIVAAARENARQVREQISTEQWQRLNRMFHKVTPHNPRNADVLHSDFHSLCSTASISSRA